MRQIFSPGEDTSSGATNPPGERDESGSNSKPRELSAAS